MDDLAVRLWDFAVRCRHTDKPLAKDILAAVDEIKRLRAEVKRLDGLLDGQVEAQR